MPPRKNKTTLIINIYQLTLQSLKNQLKLFLPFIVFAIVESAALIFIFSAPRAPFVNIFGPPIRAFWGEQFLHYPTNFLLLPKLAFISRSILTVIVGSLLTGMVVALVVDVYSKRVVKYRAIFKSTLRKYISLFLVVFIPTVIYYISVKFFTLSLAKYFMAGHNSLLSLRPGIWLGPIAICINRLFGIFLQGIFTYAIPVLVIENEGFKKAIIKSYTLFKKLFIPTIVLIALPILFYIPIIILYRNAAFLIRDLFPEFILVVSFLSIIVKSLIVDPLITVSTTFLYLENRK